MGSPKMKPGVIGTGKMVEDALFATQPDADEKENLKLDIILRFRDRHQFRLQPQH